MGTIPDCTLTTGCYYLKKYYSNALTIEDYLPGLEALLRIPCYLVIYCNKDLEEYIITIRERNKLLILTKIIVKELEELWSYKFKDKIDNNRKIFWPHNDDIRSFTIRSLIHYNKFNFILDTIHNNPFNTTKFGWIDSNLYKDGKKICEDNFDNLLLYNLKHAPNKFHLQILNVEDKKYKLDENKREYYQHARWVAVGCFYTMPKDIGIKILTRLEEIVEHTINLGYGNGEEAFFLEILDEFYDDIYRSYGDYAQTLNNYIKPVKNLVYIYWQIVMRYFHFGYYRECVDACYSIISSFDDFQTEQNYDMYVRIYSVLYLSLQQINPNQAKIVGNTIRTYYNTHPLFKGHFDNLRSLVGMNDFILASLI
jgi:hypothetical protein